ncbi:translation initiation factor IF-1 [Hyphococcus luteus]|uniref:Translation initiation factor IF-1 n=1 Tax=Hyphococcus luteus TaxID=2058213 RepID=A0A2S7K110_9PROT|nr:translation initiation factor IF-1 [Marinicaulis flavus]
MAKEDLIEFDGVVTEALPDGNYRVKLDNDHMILAYAGGKMRKHRIKTLAGDRVTIEMSSYDLTKGRITFRHKPEGARPASGNRQATYKTRGRR